MLCNAGIPYLVGLLEISQMYGKLLINRLAQITAKVLPKLSLASKLGFSQYEIF